MREWQSINHKLYYEIARIRAVEEKIAELYPSDCIKSPVHLSIGQEAIPVALCQYLNKSDVCFSSYRSHALYLAKGGSLKRMMAELFGKVDGCAQGKAGSMHLVDTEVGVMGASAVVGTTAPNATGFAYAKKIKSSNEVTVCINGDGATEQGSYYEALNFAALKELPILFLCENNGLAIHSKIENRQKNTDLVQKADAFGINGKRIDSKDFNGLLEIFENAIHYIRKNKKPMFIECVTYRDIQHVGPNNDFSMGYRKEEDAHHWREKHALIYLKSKISRNEVENIDLIIKKEINSSLVFAENSNFPSPDYLYKDVYA